MFDITQFAPTETSFLHLKSPIDEEALFVDILATISNADGLPATVKAPVGITHHSPGSEAYEAAVSKRTNRSLVRSKKKIELTADLLRSDVVNFLADITVSFDNLSYPPAGDARGEALFKALYSDRKYGWAVDQFNTHLADWAHFTKGSATS